MHRDIGAAGVFHWDELPSVVRPSYAFMAKLLASVGYNAIVLNNINACDSDTGNRQLLDSANIAKAAVLARIFAAHGIATLVSPCFASPMAVGNLSTADPAEPTVQTWWADVSHQMVAALGPGFRGCVGCSVTWGEGYVGSVAFGVAGAVWIDYRCFGRLHPL